MDSSFNQAGKASAQGDRPVRPSIASMDLEISAERDAEIRDEINALANDMANGAETALRAIHSMQIGRMQYEASAFVAGVVKGLLARDYRFGVIVHELKSLPFGDEDSVYSVIKNLSIDYYAGAFEAMIYHLMSDPLATIRPDKMAIFGRKAPKSSILLP